MAEKGNDELLAEVGDPAQVTNGAEADEQALAEEEARVSAEPSSGEG